MSSPLHSRKTKGVQSHPLHAVVVPAYDDVQEAYREAADHLEQCSYDCSVWDNPEQMRAAYRLVAKRIRASAEKCRHNDQAELTAANKK